MHKHAHPRECLLQPTSLLEDPSSRGSCEVHQDLVQPQAERICDGRCEYWFQTATAQQCPLLASRTNLCTLPRHASCIASCSVSQASCKGLMTLSASAGSSESSVQCFDNSDGSFEPGIEQQEGFFICSTLSNKNVAPEAFYTKILFMHCLRNMPRPSQRFYASHWHSEAVNKGWSHEAACCAGHGGRKAHAH